MNFLTYTIFCYTLLACGGQEFTSAEPQPVALEVQTLDAGTETSLEEATPVQEASLPAVVVDADTPEVQTLEASVDAREESEVCTTGAYKCVGESSFFCSNGSWNDIIDCQSPESCVADGRSCVE
jgi:hypothetical protein